MSVLCLLTTYHITSTGHGLAEMYTHSDFVLFKSGQGRDTQINVLITPSVTTWKRSTLHRLSTNSPWCWQKWCQAQICDHLPLLPFRKITHRQWGAVVFTRHELHAHSQISSWTLSVDKVQGTWVNIQQVPVEEKSWAEMLESLEACWQRIGTSEGRTGGQS